MKNLISTYSSLEKAVRVASLFYALIATLFFSQEEMPTALLLVFLAITSLFSYFFIIKQNYFLSVNKHFVAAIDLAIAITIVIFSHSYRNPFFFYLIAVIFSLPKILKPAYSFLATFITLEFSFLLTYFSHNLNSSLLYPFFLHALGLSIFTAVISYVLHHLQDTSLESSLPHGSYKPEKDTGELATNTILKSITFQKEIQSCYSLQSIYKQFLNFLKNNGLLPATVINFKKTNKVSFLKLVQEKVFLKDVSENFSESDFHPPDEFDLVIDNENYHFVLISDLPEISVYLTGLKEDDVVTYGVVKLTSDLFAYHTAEISLSEEEKILLTRFSSLCEAAKAASGKVEIKPILEAAAEAVKRLTGMEKSIIVLAEKPEDVKFDPEKTIVKGKVSQHPEELWRSLLIKVARKSIQESRPVFTTLSDGKSILISVPLVFKKKIYGTISGLTSLPRDEAVADLRTMEVIAALTVTSLANLDLMREREQVAISSERDRIGKEMHNSFIQSLFGMLLIIDLAIKNMKSDPENTKEKLVNLREELQRTIKETREYVYKLNPHALTKTGLKEAIKRIISSYKDTHAKIHLEIDDFPPSRIPLEIENAVLKIVHEGVMNAMKCANASNIYVQIKQRNDELEIMVKDDGKAISLENKTPSSITDNRFESITKMVESLNGKLTIESAPNKGTEAKVFIPLNPKEEFTDKKDKRSVR